MLLAALCLPGSGHCALTGDTVNWVSFIIGGPQADQGSVVVLDAGGPEIFFDTVRTDVFIDISASSVDVTIQQFSARTNGIHFSLTNLD